MSSFSIPSSLLFPRLLWLGNAFAVLASIVIPAQAHLILAPTALTSPLVLPIAHALARRGGCDSRCLGAKIGRQVWCVLWCHARMGRRNGTPDDNEERRRNLRQRGLHLGGSAGRHQCKTAKNAENESDCMKQCWVVFVSVLSNRRHRVSALRWSSNREPRASSNHNGQCHFLPVLLPLLEETSKGYKRYSDSTIPYFPFCRAIEMGATQSIARTEGPTAGAATNAAGQEASASEPYAPAPMPRLKRAETFEEKLYRKVRIHVGCASMELELCHLSLCPFRSLVPYFPTHQPMSFVRQLNQHSFRRSRSYR